MNDRVQLVRTLIRAADPLSPTEFRGSATAPKGQRLIQSIMADTDLSMDSGPGDAASGRSTGGRETFRAARRGSGPGRLAGVAAGVILVAGLAVSLAIVTHRPQAPRPEHTRPTSVTTYVSDLLRQVSVPGDARRLPRDPNVAMVFTAPSRASISTATGTAWWMSQLSVDRVISGLVHPLPRYWRSGATYTDGDGATGITAWMLVTLVEDPASPYVAQVTVRAVEHGRSSVIRADVQATRRPMRTADQIVPVPARGAEITLTSEQGTTRRTLPIEATRDLATLTNQAQAAAPSEYADIGHCAPSLESWRVIVMFPSSATRRTLELASAGCGATASIRAASARPFQLDGAQQLVDYVSSALHLRSQWWVK